MKTKNLALSPSRRMFLTFLNISSFGLQTFVWYTDNQSPDKYLWKNVKIAYNFNGEPNPITQKHLPNLEKTCYTLYSDPPKYISGSMHRPASGPVQ